MKTYLDMLDQFKDRKAYAALTSTEITVLVNACAKAYYIESEAAKNKTPTQFVRDPERAAQIHEHNASLYKSLWGKIEAISVDHEQKIRVEAQRLADEANRKERSERARKAAAARKAKKEVA